MPTYLAQWIIRKFTSIGDVVLDPMAGVGTSIIESSLLGRHGIGIEYEQKFVDLTQKSIKKSLAATPAFELFNDYPRGEMRIFQGDSRNIVFVLALNESIRENKEVMQKLADYDSEVNNIIMSPPYGHQSYKSKGAKMSQWQKEHANDWGIIGHQQADNYGESNNNIGNLKIDNVIMSPPYGHGGSVYKNIPKKIAENSPNMKGRKAYSEEAAGEYSQDPENVGNKKEEDYLSAMQQVYQGCYKVLKPGGNMILVTKNYVKQGAEQRLDLWTIKLCESVGFKHIDTWFAKLNTKSFWQILQTSRCSNIKFKHKDKFTPGELIYYVGSAVSQEPKTYKDIMVPMCAYYDAEIACPHELAQQKMCKYYESNYPTINHEHILVMKKEQT